MPITRYLDREPSEVHAAALEAFDALGFPRVADHNAPDAVGAGRMPMSARAGERVTTLDAYLPADGRTRRLTIRADAVAARVLLEAGRATGVELVDGSAIRAGRVILSAGTYGSPSILLRSGIGPADHLHALGIEVAVDLPGVGANLADHPASTCRRAGAVRGTNGPILHSIATFRSSATARHGRARPHVLGERSGRRGPGVLSGSSPPAPEVPRIRATALGRSARTAADRAARPEGTGGCRPARRGVPARSGARASTGAPAPVRGTTADRGRRRCRAAPATSSRTRTRSPTSSGPARWGRRPTAVRWSTPRARPWRRGAVGHRRLDHPRAAVGLPAHHHDHGRRAPRRAACRRLTAPMRNRQRSCRLRVSRLPTTDARSVGLRVERRRRP